MNQNNLNNTDGSFVKIEKYILGVILAIENEQFIFSMEDDPMINIIVNINSSIDYNIKTNKKLLIHIEALQNIYTNEIKNYQLINIIHSYNPHFDKSALDSFCKEGTKIWSDINDPAE